MKKKRTKKGGCQGQPSSNPVNHRKKVSKKDKIPEGKGRQDR